jgi:hypothetical protein
MILGTRNICLHSLLVILILEGQEYRYYTLILEGQEYRYYTLILEGREYRYYTLILEGREYRYYTLILEGQEYRYYTLSWPSNIKITSNEWRQMFLVPRIM